MTDHQLSFAAVVSQYAETEWGFTGTRAGMTVVQHGWCRRWLTSGHPSVLHHGGAYGADTQLHALYRDQKKATIHVYPADAKRRTLFLNQGPSVIVDESRDPLVRNEIIVQRSTFLLAAPHTQSEVLRSGTWATIRYAVRQERPVCIVWPNGKMTLHRNKTLYRIT